MNPEDTTQTNDSALPRATYKEGADLETPGTDLETKVVREIGGPKAPEPTRYGDWEQGGRCTDF